MPFGVSKNCLCIFFLTSHAGHLIYESRCGLLADRANLRLGRTDSMKNATKKAAKKAAKKAPAKKKK